MNSDDNYYNTQSCNVEDDEDEERYIYKMFMLCY